LSYGKLAFGDCHEGLGVKTQHDHNPAKNCKVFQPWVRDDIIGFWYQGEWNSHGEREGKGIRVDDKTVMLGHWKQNKVDGHVTTFHDNGIKLV